MSNVENLIASRFIARTDVKAVQHRDGSWSPHTDTGKRDGKHIPWSRADLEAHVSRKKTFGHYLLNQDDQCKLFAFDIDLNDKGVWPEGYTSIEEADKVEPVEFNPREAWLDRKHPARPWLKWQFKYVASVLMSSIHRTLEIPCAAAYSGGKGIHVYGFTGLKSATYTREAMQIVLDDVGIFKIKRGKNFYEAKDQDYWTGLPNLSVETFPKQESLSGGDGLGNLMRLPLGRNLKSNDPTFFIDMTSPVGQLAPIDPVFAMTTRTPWRRPGE